MVLLYEVVLEHGNLKKNVCTKIGIYRHLKACMNISEYKGQGHYYAFNPGIVYFQFQTSPQKPLGQL